MTAHFARPKVSEGKVFRDAPNLSAEGEATPSDPSGHRRVGDAVEEVPLAPSVPADRGGLRGAAADSRPEVEALDGAGDSPHGWKQTISRVRDAKGKVYSKTGLHEMKLRRC